MTAQVDGEDEKTSLYVMGWVLERSRRMDGWMNTDIRFLTHGTTRSAPYLVATLGGYAVGD